MKRLSLMFVFLLSTVFAGTKPDLDKYRLYVTDRDPAFHCVALSNNMVFNIPQKNWAAETLPEVGAEVYIELAPRVIDGRSPPIVDSEFLIKFSADPKKKPVTVWLCKDADLQCVSYVSHESVCTQRAGWLTSAVFQSVLTLSDGSHWIVNEAEIKFKKGDRIIVSHLKENDYLLIDIDRDLDMSKCIASKDALTCQRAVRVIPYIPKN